MPNTLIVGIQWGDEGKGKSIDILSETHDAIVRYQGGGNAGHTVVIGGEKYALHLLPSGVLRAEKVNILGNNVLIDPPQVLKEIEGLKERGISVTPESLKISHIAPILLQYHKALDSAKESAKKGKKIGTTGKGIGPAYEEKAGRRILRVCDLYLLSDSELKSRIRENVKLANHVIDFYKGEKVSPQKIIKEVFKTRDELVRYSCDNLESVLRSHDGSILGEGAQGVMLDVDHGSWPFVTSSNPTKAGFYKGTGAGWVNFDDVIGVLKAYTTRVGEGPFPTELNGKTGERIRKNGGEFGTTTGRPRRCGWLDLEVAKYAINCSGITSIAITKLDVLDKEKEIKVCTGYKIDGKEVHRFPIEQLGNVDPMYATVPGWMRDTSNVRTWDGLPRKAKAYITWIEGYLGVPIKMIGVGQDRKQVIVRD